MTTKDLIQLSGLKGKFQKSQWALILALVFFFALTFLIPRYGLLNEYIQLIIIYIGINIIMAVSLNMVNGYMGDFSLGHAGFMLIGAYISSILTVWVFPRNWNPIFTSIILFPIAVTAGGLAAALASLIIAFPSFKTRGDYLALVTLAFNMICVSVVQNIEAIGAGRGFMGMKKLTTMPWVFIWALIAIWVVRNFVYSNLGRGTVSIREDETAAELVGVNTRQVKVLTFVISSFFAGVGGALFAHILQFITPSTFQLQKNVDFLVMIYLGGMGSIGGSILGAVTYTVILELLREALTILGTFPIFASIPSLEVWRWVLAPLLLILLMIYRNKGIMGLREFGFLVPFRDQFGSRFWLKRRELTNANSSN
jgi:branched-chain amino acid transport system permease protein